MKKMNGVVVLGLGVISMIASSGCEEMLDDGRWEDLINGCGECTNGGDEDTETAGRCDPLGLEPLLYLPFDGTAEDASGLENHGIATGIVYEEGTQGGTDLGAVFDGDGSYVELPYLMDLTEKSWSYSIWLKLSALPTRESDMFLLTRKDVKTYDDVYLFVDNAGNELQSWSEDGRTDSNVALETDRWYHLAAVYDVDSLTLYVDGEPMRRSTAQFSTDYPEDSPLIIASIMTDGGDGWSVDPNKGRIWGTVDDVRLYNSPLTDEQVALLYAADMPN